ncbi:trypsin-like peptidase domain-containing protein [Microcoleus sp. FACHB-1515]|uniref:S1C family serine protease n=1 Tax=Cyanophyceae TaxID=3028117 RepID=UPI001687E846|nr:trypsin-like peptidase domain-containing protein [Microcoleus sp. FACHB-1515]MBD2090340.1 trypsin-like peptidase domain-containing protein [Microcoleus sp. FACHB-1515]
MSATLAELSNSLSSAIAQAGESIVAINGRRRSASGIHWQSGIIVTAEHMLKRDEEIGITWADGTTSNATLIGRDGGTDLAVLRVEGSDRPTVQIANPEALQVGNLVMAIARSAESGISASMGVISALGGSWRSWHGGQIDRFIRPDLTLYPGFSGGALIDTEGQIIGMNTAGPRHWTLTIPAATIQRVVDQLGRGRIARGYLGLGMQPVQLPDSLKSSLRLAGGGVIVVSVEPDAPADRAGVLIGDIIVRLADQPISDVRDVHALLDPDRVGQPLPAEIVRAGTLTQLTITVGARP